MARKKLLTEGEVRQFMKLANLGSLSETYLSSHPLREQPGEDEDLEGAADVDQLGALEDEEMALGDEEMALDDEAPVEGGEENEELLARVVRVVADELGVEADIEGAGGEEGGEDLEIAALDVEDEEPLPGEGDEELAAMGVGGEPEPPGSRGGVYERKKAAPLNEMVGLTIASVTAALAPLLPAGVSAKAAALGIMALLGGAAAAEAGPERVVKLPDDDLPPEEEVGGGAQLGSALREDAVVAEVSRRVAQRLMQDKQKEEMAGKLAERIFDRLTQK
jgi:hypothetical protein